MWWRWYRSKIKEAGGISGTKTSLALRVGCLIIQFILLVCLLCSTVWSFALVIADGMSLILPSLIQSGFKNLFSFSLQGKYSVQKFK